MDRELVDVSWKDRPYPGGAGAGYDTHFSGDSLRTNTSSAYIDRNLGKFHPEGMYFYKGDYYMPSSIDVNDLATLNNYRKLPIHYSNNNLPDDKKFFIPDIMSRLSAREPGLNWMSKVQPAKYGRYYSPEGKFEDNDPRSSYYKRHYELLGYGPPSIGVGPNNSTGSDNSTSSSDNSTSSSDNSTGNSFNPAYGAILGGLLGGGLGLLRDPGKDSQGRQRSRLARALGLGLGGAAIGGAATYAAPKLFSMFGKQSMDATGNNIALLGKIAAKQARCWEGYEPVPGKKPYSEDSCRPAGAGKKKEKKADCGCGGSKDACTCGSCGSDNKTDVSKLAKPEQKLKKTAANLNPTSPDAKSPGNTFAGGLGCGLTGSVIGNNHGQAAGTNAAAVPGDNKMKKAYDLGRGLGDSDDYSAKPLRAVSRLASLPERGNDSRKFYNAAISNAVKNLPENEQLRWLDENAELGQRSRYNPLRYIAGKEILGPKVHSLDRHSDQAAKDEVINKLMAFDDGKADILLAHDPARKVSKPDNVKKAYDLGRGLGNLSLRTTEKQADWSSYIPAIAALGVGGLAGYGLGHSGGFDSGHSAGYDQGYDQGTHVSEKDSLKALMRGLHQVMQQGRNSTVPMSDLVGHDDDYPSRLELNRANDRDETGDDLADMHQWVNQTKHIR